MTEKPHRGEGYPKRPSYLEVPGLIKVTEEEYEREIRRLTALEEQLRRLESEWRARVEGRILVTREEFERQEREIRRIESEVRRVSRRVGRLWSDWGTYMARRRWALRESTVIEEEIGFLRRELRRAPAWERPDIERKIRELESRLRSLRAEAGRYLALVRDVATEISRSRRRLGEVTEELEGKRLAHAMKVLMTPDLERLRREMEKVRREIGEEREQIARKIIARNKVIALHLRWVYESTKRRGHDISIEAVATIVVPVGEPKEKYEEALESAMWSAISEQPGFERLVRVLGEPIVLGFQERLTLEEPRDVEVHDLVWVHEAVKRGRLIDKERFMPKDP